MDSFDAEGEKNTFTDAQMRKNINLLLTKIMYKNHAKWKVKILKNALVLNLYTGS